MHGEREATPAITPEDAAWYAANTHRLETAYLAESDPRRQSGANADAARWERRRRVIAAAIDRDGTLLDVGCANGHLLETLVEWARADGHTVEPYGLDISARLAALARQRLPGWADRIGVGNAMTWDPPRDASTSCARSSCTCRRRGSGPASPGSWSASWRRVGG